MCIGVVFPAAPSRWRLLCATLTDATPRTSTRATGRLGSRLAGAILFLPAGRHSPLGRTALHGVESRPRRHGGPNRLATRGRAPPRTAVAPFGRCPWIWRRSPGANAGTPARGENSWTHRSRTGTSTPCARTRIPAARWVVRNLWTRWSDVWAVGWRQEKAVVHTSSGRASHREGWYWSRKRS